MATVGNMPVHWIPADPQACKAFPVSQMYSFFEVISCPRLLSGHSTHKNTGMERFVPYNAADKIVGSRYAAL